MSSCCVSLICLSTLRNNLCPIFFGETVSQTFSHWSATLIPLFERAESIIGGINVFFLPLWNSFVARAVIVVSVREMEGGRKLLCDFRTICLVLARHSVLLSISTYKYIHFSQLAFQRSLANAWAMGSGNRLKLGRALEAMPVIALLMRNGRKEGALWSCMIRFFKKILDWLMECVFFQQLDIPCMHWVLCMVSHPYNS